MGRGAKTLVAMESFKLRAQTHVTKFFYSPRR